ncbi:MAG: hydroxymethylbilane synthase [Candidatus Marinimicrobia bacterium]|nr:hydroxymethylbilane synthase [Candidatus Neomarinimicrobiota bacterium]
MGIQNIVIGSRGSQLALWQSNLIKSLLEKQYLQLEVTIKVIRTKGDAIQDVPLPKIGDKGLFTTELEDALTNGSIDLAVHSLKDLPTTLPTGLAYVGSPRRANPSDAFVSTKWNRLNELPTNAIIATGSVRRQALIRGLNPGIQFESLRGNIDTRLKKLEKLGWDGIIMATAALQRLGLDEYISEEMPMEEFVPSVGQGAIGIEIREDRDELITLLKPIIHSETIGCCNAERAFGRKLEAGCSIPLGAWARRVGDSLVITGFVSNFEGSETILESLTGSFDQPELLGNQLADQFIAKGARELLGT